MFHLIQIVSRILCCCSVITDAYHPAVVQAPEMLATKLFVLPIIPLLGILCNSITEAHEFRQGSKLRILTDETFEHDTQASTGSTTGALIRPLVT